MPAEANHEYATFVEGFTYMYIHKEKRDFFSSPDTQGESLSHPDL